MVSNQLSAIVNDATGLKGKYDIVMTYQQNSRSTVGGRDVPLESADGDTGVPLVAALPSQLGLKLESKKALVEMIVVDHAEKAPTEN